MAEANKAQDTYAMGRTEAETQRLIRTSQDIAPAMRRLLQDAGIAGGMKVLDVGSGAGDVAMVAAELVGPSGTVIGLDMNPAILETARQRAAEAGLANLSFIAGDMREDLDLDHDFDAVVGRFFFSYLADPVRVLRTLVSHLKAGGIAAFQEVEMSIGARSYPPCPLRQQVSAWIQQAMVVEGQDLSIGLRQCQIFLDAGLPQPEMRAHAGVVGPYSDGFESAAAIMRSHLPHLIQHGITTAEEVDIDTLAQRLTEERRRNRAVVLAAPFIDAWARKH